MTPLSVVAGIIENQEGLILLAQRPAHKPLSGYWEFPGGKIETGESPQEALHRELHEELELPVQVLHDLGRFFFTYDWGALDLSVFVVRALGVPKATFDVQIFKWVQPEELRSVRLAPADVEPMATYLNLRSGL